MGSALTFCCVMLGIICFFRGIAAKAKEKKDNDLLGRNPEAWRMQKLLELEERDRKVRAAAGAANWWLKRWLK